VQALRTRACNGDQDLRGRHRSRGARREGQAALYQIVREALDGATPWPADEIQISVQRTSDGHFVTTISDDGSQERRREFFDMLTERARTLSGRLAVEQQAGTRIVLDLPASAARE
jgi:nitrate/nitrite-specific signal transduction histidine kinase